MYTGDQTGVIRNPTDYDIDIEFPKLAAPRHSTFGAYRMGNVWMADVRDARCTSSSCDTNGDNYLSGWVEQRPIRFPPCLPIPGALNHQSLDTTPLFWPPHILPSYKGQTFPMLCKFWTFLQEINILYDLSSGISLNRNVSLAMAESKFQQLLAWTDSIAPEMHRGEQCPSHVFFFHAVYHCAVLTLFQPLIILNKSYSFVRLTRWIALQLQYSLRL